MFQFPRFAFDPYVFRTKYLHLISVNASPSCDGLTITDIEGGFPHSEIRGSKLVRSSPRLIAAYHVLHRLSAPRHPPDTLMTLDCSHNQRAFGGQTTENREQMIIFICPLSSDLCLLNLL